MHVVMVSDHETTGGAAIAASRLADALVQRGHQVTRVVAFADGRTHSWATRDLRSERVPYRLLSVALPRLGERSSERRVVRKLRHLLDEVQPDVVNVHNLHGAPTRGWTVSLAAASARAAPTFWTLHDMWSFTGSCAYSFGCDQFVSGCTETCRCPALYPRVPAERLAAEWQVRRRLLDDHPKLVAITPSVWLHDQAAAGLWRGHRVEVVPNGVPLDEYRPYAEADARRRLNIDAASFAAIVASPDLSDPRKGWSLLSHALRIVHREHRPAIMLVGRNVPEPLRAETGIYALGFIEDPASMALAYSAADVSIHPSLADNFPNTVVESLACGTPAIGFDIGGVPELIEDGRTGWVAGEPSAENLAGAIGIAARERHATSSLKRSAREKAEAMLSVRSQAARYEELFSG